MSDRFDRPVRIKIGTTERSVETATDAAALLGDVDWPGERGPAHRDAYETCLKVIDGHRSAADARARFAEAARAAGLLAGS
ncbi:MAG: DUF982 domain-containing protein [Rhizobiaceae bacterium]|nr:DUF982 domain-containing protein [Rhizobiaceae bacterium]